MKDQFAEPYGKHRCNNDRQWLVDAQLRRTNRQYQWQHDGGTLEGSCGGELTINAVQSLTIGSAIADNGGPTALVKTGSGTLTLTGSNTYTGNTYLNQGTLVYAPSSNLSYGGVIGGIGAFTKSGSGQLTLTGTSTYTGPTTVSQGTLAVNGCCPPPR